MAFFIDPKHFTHRARFYGIPCYFAPGGLDGASLAGTNVVFDWLILHFCPVIHWLCETALWLRSPADYEPSPWRIEIVGPLEKP